MPEDVNEKDKQVLEELKITSDDYRYKDQLMVTEFGLSMTAVAIALNAVVRLEVWSLECLSMIGISLFLLIISNHMTHINKDRLRAGRRKHQIMEQLKMMDPHKGFAGKRRGIPAPLSMVIFCWVVFVVFAVMAVYTFIALQSA